MAAQAAAVAAAVVQLGSDGLALALPLGAAALPPWDDTARLFAYLHLPLLHAWLPAPGAAVAGVDVAAVLRRAPGLTNEAVTTPGALPPAGVSPAEWAALQQYAAAPPPADAFNATPAGVAAVTEALAPGQFGVLYGANHFSTVFRFPIPSPGDGAYSLYRLVFEGGVERRAEGLAAWQRFDAAPGDAARSSLADVTTDFTQFDDRMRGILSVLSLLQARGGAPRGHSPPRGPPPDEGMP